MGTWLWRWTIDTHLPMPVGQAECGCPGRIWANHRGAWKCRLQRWSVGTSKPRRSGSLLPKAQRFQEACGCVRKAEDRGRWWSAESRRIQQLCKVLALYLSSTQDQASREPRQQDQDEALVLLRQWEADSGSAGAKMICIPHNIYVIINVLSYSTRGSQPSIL